MDERGDNKWRDVIKLGRFLEIWLRGEVEALEFVDFS
jgi:hypothetical protein